MVNKCLWSFDVLWRICG